MGMTPFKASYDAWGNQTLITETLFFRRGYTGHEMLPEYGLINMNGRLYDPKLGRFLSPDNYVQMPDFSQSFNRYSYCINNPLKFTDPDGEWFHFLIGGLIGGTLNWIMNGCKFNAKGLGYFTVGAAAGALGAGIGGGISSALPVAGNTAGGFAAGFWGTNAATSATSCFVSGSLIGGGTGLSSGFISGFGNALLSGNNIGNALKQGGINALFGGLSGATIGGLSSGFDAVINGRRFWDGAKLIEEKSIVDMNMPLVRSKGTHNCVPATLESVDKSYGGNISQDVWRSWFGGDPNTNGVDLGQAMYTLEHYTNGSHTLLNNIEDIPTNMLNQNRVLLNISAGAGKEGHLVVMNNIVRKTYLSVRGHQFVKWLYYIMDPARGFRRISTDVINHSDIISYSR